MFYRKAVLKIFVKLTGKHLHRNLFFYKVAALNPATMLGLLSATLLIKRLQHRGFRKNFVKFFKFASLQTSYLGAAFQDAIVTFHMF